MLPIVARAAARPAAIDFGPIPQVRASEKSGNR
jgi:hypothetical protein